MQPVLVEVEIVVQEVWLSLECQGHSEWMDFVGERTLDGVLVQSPCLIGSMCSRVRCRCWILQGNLHLQRMVVALAGPESALMTLVDS